MDDTSSHPRVYLGIIFVYSTCKMSGTSDIDPSLSKAQKTIDGLKSKNDKQNETINDLKKQD